ncbi:Adenylate-forming reductase Nps11 [Fulvia fulva]|uniref:Adenylate-forming reductase Nps11 n=1 Tax=Passalora fulva TaxID=5499 RepID=A0A9Q8L9U0_PASFU|nr:Adenylate-forming reductase Nps11 [Fulvia fulva]KAK4632092.1 Adenylate-forming reductase Nps11 [Fulvia fulva]KAK4633076.1 Adenylate-forming reductase Nps11 [Fulvia fulva]UJO13459.1 Adenylate-forming reductase Nps11 [Fulvia fulva]WPV11591.1 Adenylate-forming reductase Nps11 [Fulvia fulva]WPV26093.1 Adenylate-forming reductase Nps11 [Fulvia fulva]
MASNDTAQPIKGGRTLIQTLLARVESDPDRLYGSFPLTHDIEDGFYDFTFGELGRAVDHCAWMIKDCYGTSTHSETLLFMGARDFCYTIVFLCCLEVRLQGYCENCHEATECSVLTGVAQACFPNTGSSISDNCSILDQVGCTKALHTAYTKELLEACQKSRPQLCLLELPTLQQFFEALARPFQYTPRPWEEAKHDPMLVIHSSGTTGAPKPLVLRNGYIKGLDSHWSGGGAQMSMFDKLDGAFYYTPFPAYHLGGFLSMTVMPTMSMYSTPVMAPPGHYAMRDGPLVLRIIEKRNVKMIVASPALLEAISQMPNGTSTSATLDCVGFGGGPLRESLGDELSSQNVRLINIYGSSEACWLPTRTTEMVDWEWLDFHPDLKIDWRDAGHGDGTHELCFADEAPVVNELRGTYWSLQRKDWRSKDIFVQHETKPWLWKLSGRQDDMLILATGSMINPIPMEDIVAADESVSGALMGGENRWPPCMLVECQDPCGDVQAFVQQIWPRIEAANELVREDSRIPYRNVAVVGPGLFVRNPKGGVVRGRTVQKLANTIDGMYT